MGIITVINLIEKVNTTNCFREWIDSQTDCSHYSWFWNGKPQKKAARRTFCGIF